MSHDRICVKFLSGHFAIRSGLPPVRRSVAISRLPYRILSCFLRQSCSKFCELSVENVTSMNPNFRSVLDILMSLKCVTSILLVPPNPCCHRSVCTLIHYILSRFFSSMSPHKTNKHTKFVVVIASSSHLACPIFPPTSGRVFFVCDPSRSP